MFWTKLAAHFPSLHGLACLLILFLARLCEVFSGSQRCNFHSIGRECHRYKASLPLCFCQVWTLLESTWRFPQIRRRPPPFCPPLPQLWSCLAWYHSSIFKQISHQSHAQNSTSTITWARDFDLNIAHSKASLDRLHFITITRVTLPKIGHLQALLTGGVLPLILLTPNLWMLSPSKKSLLKNHTTPAEGAQSPGQSEPKAKHDHSDQHKAHRQSPEPEARQEALHAQVWCPTLWSFPSRSRMGQSTSVRGSRSVSLL